MRSASQESSSLFVLRPALVAGDVHASFPFDPPTACEFFTVNQRRYSELGTRQRRWRTSAALSRAFATEETAFFEDRRAFEELKSIVLPLLVSNRRHSRSLRIWCGGCSTGQYAYSLAMTLCEWSGVSPNWSLEIVASDSDAAVLARAARGVFSQYEIQQGVSLAMLLRHFDEFSEGTNWQFKSRVCPRMSWIKLARESSFASIGAVDLLFCLHRIDGPDAAARRDEIRRMIRQLVPDGVLFLRFPDSAAGPECGLERIDGCNSCFYRRTRSDSGFIDP